MAITRKKKEQLVSLYGDVLENSVNAVVIAQVGLPVNEVNNLRKSLKKT
jgi:ribosomal protein L10